MSIWSKAFERVEPGHQPTPPPRDLTVWTSQTSCGILGGFMFGAYRGLLQSRTSTPSPIPANSVVHRTAMFVIRDGIFIGARVGLFVSMFSGLAIGAREMRGNSKENPVDYGIAGAITCGLYGGAMSGWRGVIPTALFGGIFSGGVSYVQEMIQGAVGISEEDTQIKLATQKEKKEKEVEEKLADTIDILIERFEDSLQQSVSDESKIADDLNNRLPDKNPNLDG